MKSIPRIPCQCTSPFLRLTGVILLAIATKVGANPPPLDDDGAVHVPAFVLPESALLSEETRATYKKERASDKEDADAPERCASDRHADASQIAAIRRCKADVLYASAYYQHLRELYPVEIASAQIGGVASEVFVPKDGISAKNRTRVLINLHGGGFLGGSRTISHIESIPIASV
jgi:hypothetical protein